MQQLTDEPTTATKPKRTPKVRPHEKPAVAPTAKTTDTVPEPTTSEPTPAPATPAAPPVTTTPATTAPATPTVAPTSVSLGTNGVCELVAVKSTFPSATQLFQLVSIAPDGQSVKIGVAGGSLQSGDPTVTVTAAKSVTLVNTADGVRYKLELLSSCPASTATPPPTTTTEPTTTLTATTP